LVQVLGENADVSLVLSILSEYMAVYRLLQIKLDYTLIIREKAVWPLYFSPECLLNCDGYSEKT
jgi:hypothetical protein